MLEFVALQKKNDRGGSPKTTLPVVTVKETEQRINLSYHFSGFFRHDVERTVKGKDTIRLDNVQIFPAQENMMDGPSLEQELEFDA